MAGDWEVWLEWVSPRKPQDRSQGIVRGGQHWEAAQISPSICMWTVTCPILEE